MIPYLKGFHLTNEMWRGNRDSEGWKLPSRVVAAQDKRDGLVGTVDDGEAELAYLMRKKTSMMARAPASGTTPIAPRLLADLCVLQALTASPVPPLRVVRPTRVVQVLYGFADASGKGLGSTVQGYPSRALSESPTNPRFRVGVWGKDDESESSNFRELANLVLTVEDKAAAGHLDLAEFVLFTDNSTAESAFYKGSSTSPKLHEFVLRLGQLELHHGLSLHAIHVSGTRMIAQGTDGCSRGGLLEGVMAGEDMLSFVDLGKTAFERSPALLKWVRSWCLDASIEPLSPEDWFQRGHGITGGHRDKRNVWIPTHEPPGRTHLWAPPPAAADAALEELLKARHKRFDTTRIVVIPRLMTPCWRRLFHKVADCCFTVAPGTSFWPTDMYEPLWVAVVLPYHKHSPWQLGRAPLMADLGRKLHRMCSDSEAGAGHFLRKLCKLPAWHGLCYECLGQDRFPLAMLHDDSDTEWVKQGRRATRLNTACDGVHSVMTFQCELCWVRNLAGRDMVLSADEQLRQCIRRANLDAFAGQAKSTIASHVRGVRRSVQISLTLNKPTSVELTPRGPMMVGDPVGMSLTIEVLMYSVNSEGRVKEYIQFDTMHKLRCTLSRCWDSSPPGVAEGAAFSKGTGKVRLTSRPSQSQWFADFLLGAQDRMGYDTKKQLPLSILAIVKILELIKSDMEERDLEEARTTLSHLNDGRNGEIPKKFKKNQLLTETEVIKLPSVCVCLIGKFKGETGERYHSIVLTNESTSGLQTRWWVEELMKLCAEEGRTSGFAFADVDNIPPDPTEYNALFRQYLIRLQKHHPDLLSIKEDVTHYGISRSLCKSAVTCAGKAGLSDSEIGSVNRWQSVEQAIVLSTTCKHIILTREPWHP
ncbi:hypothetical protein ACHAWO_009694 [Cyclotella atomus]|uniref:Uncharacterized protein n=1 Tax=Cyclotella atomus TaxID=382360 RepID=A0ABD3NWQ6_9STRA